MAVYTYGTTDITWSSTDAWANKVQGLSNISSKNSGTAQEWPTDIYSDVGTTSISIGKELQSKSLFYGNVRATANGSVRVSAPYTTSYTTGAIAVKNVNLSVHGSVSLQASATYPYLFQKWTVTNSSSATSVGNSTTLTLGVGDRTGNTDFYAWFTTPSSYSVNLSYSAQDVNACDGAQNTTVYWSQSDGNNWANAYIIYQDSALTKPIKTAGYYGDGQYYAYINASGQPGIPTPCGLLYQP